MVESQRCTNHHEYSRIADPMGARHSLSRSVLLRRRCARVAGEITRRVDSTRRAGHHWDSRALLCDAHHPCGRPEPQKDRPQRARCGVHLDRWAHRHHPVERPASPGGRVPGQGRHRLQEEPDPFLLHRLPPVKPSPARPPPAHPLHQRTTARRPRQNQGPEHRPDHPGTHPRRTHRRLLDLEAARAPGIPPRAPGVEPDAAAPDTPPAPAVIGRRAPARPACAGGRRMRRRDRHAERERAGERPLRSPCARRASPAPGSPCRRGSASESPGLRRSTAARSP